MRTGSYDIEAEAETAAGTGVSGGTGVIIPAYEVASAVADVIRSCLGHPCLQGVIVIDDGSMDETAAVAARAGAEVIRHERNMGKGAALMTGFAAASERGWESAVTIDSDGQHDPAFIPDLVACHQETGAEIVIGTRPKAGTDMPLQRRLSNHMSSLLVTRLSGQTVIDSQSGYRLISRRVWETITFTRTRYDMESELLIKAGRAGFRIGHAYIRTQYGDERSHFRPLTDTYRMARLFLSLYLLDE